MQYEYSIHYEGFIALATSRIYNFSVTNRSGEPRSFTVHVPSESFQMTLLKYQDGPSITFERLQCAIDGESQESQAEGDFNISGQDIEEYLQRHSPRKRTGKWSRPQFAGADGH